MLKRLLVIALVLLIAAPQARAGRFGFFRRNCGNVCFTRCENPCRPRCQPVCESACPVVTAACNTTACESSCAGSATPISCSCGGSSEGQVISSAAPVTLPPAPTPGTQSVVTPTWKPSATAGTPDATAPDMKAPANSLSQPEPMTAPEVATEPAPPTPTAPSDVDSLFDESPTPKATPKTPNAMPKDDFSTPEDNKSIDSIFDSTQHQAAPEAATADDIELFSQIDFSSPATKTVDVRSDRKWVDVTGKFEVVGRLVEVKTNAVRLLKETGKFTTVPMDRLSQQDRAFVNQFGHMLTATASLK
jgi:hypothetical protein